MSRTPSRFAFDSWQRLVAAVLIVALFRIGFPPPAQAASIYVARKAAYASKPSAIANALASARMSLRQADTRLRLAESSVVSRLTPPSEFARLSSQFEEPLIPTGATSWRENRELGSALERFRDRAQEDDFSALRGFLKDHPSSAWRVAILTNLGLLDYHYGYFSRAIVDWGQAWETGKTYTDPKAHAVVDRAVSELARMHARLGHADALQALFKEVGNRKVTGSATELLTGAHDGLWMMRNDPGVSYLCGPMALKSLLLAQGASLTKVEFLDDYRSGPNGVSFDEVTRLAARAGLHSQLIYRASGQAVPIPSIVHWKVNHFAALLGYANGRYHVQDPTFGTDLWITPAALEAESSGYFLVAQANSIASWKPVDARTAQQIHGMGYTNQQQTGRSTCNPAEGGNCSCSGSPMSGTGASGTGAATGNQHLCGYGISEMTVSLNLNDIPVGYDPPVGPSAKVGILYNQREDSQPATFAWYNVSPKWTLSTLSYIQDDPRSAGSSVSRYAAGGGSLAYSGFNSTTKAFTPETSNGAILVQTSAVPVKYTRTFPDGHQEIYAQSNGATTYPRLVFLSQMTDTAGNALTLNYDALLRLTSLTDATGRNTTFSYASATSFLVTTITDPFGRSAQLSYDASGRLNQIQDVLGLKSQFTYDASSLINALTTPYGTTHFAYSDSVSNPTGDVTRWLTATDPLGHTERMEYGINDITGNEAGNVVPSGMSATDAYLYYRDSFYWDKHAYAVAAGNYLMARNIHWHHWSPNTNETADSIESTKEPLENRVYYDYEGQGGPYYSGTYDKPTVIGRVLDNGASQLTQMTYNAQGNMTSVIDPLGRTTQISYATNGIDLLTVKQKTSASGYSTIAQFTYNTQHLPLTYTDAAGQTTILTYNSAGQLTQMTDALGESTKYNYDGLGYLTSITNANGQTQASFTYGQYGDVSTATDSEGYSVAYTYDAFDRVTQTTYPDGTTRRYGYTNLDLTSVTDRQNNTMQYAYDAVRNLLSTTDPLNHVTKLGYWENQSLKSLTDPNGNTTAWNIDVQSRVTGKQYADGTQILNGYQNSTSRLKSVTDAMNQVKTFTYANDDTLTGLTYTKTVNPTPNVTFAYDPYFRRITSMTDGNGTRSYSYEPVGSLGALQLLKESGPYTNDSIQYGYDQLSRLFARTVDTSTETFAYDALSRLTAHGTALGTFNLDYLGQTGQLTSRQIGTGTVGSTWKYDSNTNDRRLLSIINSGATRSYNYTTTPENLITQTQETAPTTAAYAPKTWNYQYDAAYRLTQASSSAGVYNYGLDPTDNVTSLQSPAGATSASYNNLNQVVSYGAHSYTYDKNGNVLDDGLRTYSWDAENRILSIASKSNTSQRTSFTYDGLGRRTTVTTTNNGMSTENRYLWCGETLCQERTITDTVERRYYPEGEYLPTGGTSLYYSQDQLGSVRDVLAIQSGGRVASFDYDPFGNSTQSSGRTSTDFRFAQMFYDQQDGLYLTYYRVLNPENGHWLSRDPAGEQMSLNLYGYVEGNVVGATDPSGLASCEYTISTHTLVCTPNAGGTPLTLGPSGVWSGVGSCANNASCSSDSHIGPIVPGNYNMNQDTRPGHSGFWRLEPNPPVSALQYYLGLRRNGFELHLGTISLGCITGDKNSPSTVSQYNSINQLLTTEKGSNTLKVVP